MIFLLKALMFITSFVLIVLILLQRGRGGGLAGALGGMGGQSAFGSKAGDVFTRITSGVAVVWIFLLVASLKILSSPNDLFDARSGGDAPPAAQESIERQPGTAGKQNTSGKQNPGPVGKTGGPTGSTSSAADEKKSSPPSE